MTDGRHLENSKKGHISAMA